MRTARRKARKKPDISKRQKLSPPQIARLWGIDPHTVCAWIRAGLLKAINLTTDPTRRPRYLVDRSDIAEFERLRTVVKQGGSQ